MSYPQNTNRYFQQTPYPPPATTPHSHTPTSYQYTTFDVERNSNNSSLSASSYDNLNTSGYRDDKSIPLNPLPKQPLLAEEPSYPPRKRQVPCCCCCYSRTGRW